MNDGDDHQSFLDKVFQDSYLTPGDIIIIAIILYFLYQGLMWLYVTILPVLPIIALCILALVISVILYKYKKNVFMNLGIILG